VLPVESIPVTVFMKSVVEAFEDLIESKSGSDPLVKVAQ
jgi:hypothetical protein